MGVKRCNRNGCSVVMCDRYSSDHGYICEDCYSELVTMLPYMTTQEFMALDKPSFNEQYLAKTTAELHFRDG